MGGKKSSGEQQQHRAKRSAGEQMGVQQLSSAGAHVVVFVVDVSAVLEEDLGHSHAALLARRRNRPPPLQ